MKPPHCADRFIWRNLPILKQPALIIYEKHKWRENEFKCHEHLLNKPGSTPSPTAPDIPSSLDYPPAHKQLRPQASNQWL